MKSIFITSGFFLLSLTIAALISCTHPNNKKPEVQSFSLDLIKTIGLLPITYDPSYPPPLPIDLRGKGLSERINRQIENKLTEKGYKVQKTTFSSEVKIEPSSEPLKMAPSVLAEHCSCETDGIMQIHVTFHYGIDPTQRSVDFGSPEQIVIYAKARMIDKATATELWQGSGRARPFRSGNFYHRLNFAVRSLAGNLIDTFPSH